MPATPATRWAVALLGLAGSLTLAACTSAHPDQTTVGTPTTSAAAATTPANTSASVDTHKATQMVTMSTIDGTGVGHVTLTRPVLTKTSDSSIHGDLYRIRVTVQAVSGSFEVVPGYFTAQNSAGDTYQPLLVETGGDLSDATVPAGRYVRGYLGFDVPNGQTIASVTLVDGYNKPAGTWDWADPNGEPSTKTHTVTQSNPAQQAAADQKAGNDLRMVVVVAVQCFTDNGSYPAGSGSAAVVLTGTKALPGCTGMPLHLSRGTTVRYYATANAPSSYVATSINSRGGARRFFCYDSAKGGGVVAVTKSSANAC